MTTINNTAKRNAMSRGMMAELADLWEQLDTDSNCRCIVLTGAGEKAFSAGADLKPDTQYTALTLDESALEHPYVQFARGVRKFSKPLIAHVGRIATSDCA